MPKLTRVLFLIVASLSVALPYASAQEQFKLDLEQVQVRDVTVPEGEAPIALLHFTFEIA